ncbi:helix-turn-helix transcriptional regulator [Effusibacillus lacus]|uniref:Molybdate-binding protein n=1 Tax=Effusibacillus lacus TaxID=1348429 RepID=A0A292YRU9_9BACL|nr:helix-turn-helix transcriptional regulator [Effusibacillus lacus]TCS76803.1 putative molybdopterin biosynthesis protein [Effusibacillus lacus]GAX91134.1 molybdate-binding protein [Effusibacillus lacus]
MTGKAPLTAEEAAQILKISKYTLYELVKRGKLPAQKIGRQLRIDPDSLDRYLRGNPQETRPIGTSSAKDEFPASVLQGLRFIGSHDPILELLIEFLKHSAVPISLSSSFTGSMEGLIALYKRKADIAGVHLWDDKTEEYNLPFIQYILPGEPITVVNLVQRVQGWIVQPGNPLKLQTWEDIAKRGLRFVNRQKGSGTRLRLDSYLRSSGISPAAIEGYEIEESTHFGVACRIANGEADGGIGVQAAAIRMGLDFAPLFHERYDLVCLGETTRSPEWQQILSVLRSPAFHNAVRSQAGYDTSLTGTIMSFA